MTGPIRFTAEALAKLKIFDDREKLTEEYIASCKGVKGTWQERNEQLQNLRKEYIKKYLEMEPTVADLNLISFTDTLFYEFDRTRCVVKDLLKARRDVWEDILSVYTSGKINDETLVNLMRFIGVERDFYDETMCVGGLGKDCIDDLSLFDAKIINRRFRHDHFFGNMCKVKDAFYGQGALYSQFQKIFEEKAQDCFNSKDCKQYMFDILTKASEHVADKSCLSSAIEKKLSKVDALEVSSGKGRTYLNLTYDEEEMYYERLPQSIADYIEHGEQYETRYKTVTHEYNPAYIKNRLPKEINLNKDDNGYYLTQSECEISNAELQRMAKRYERTQEKE